MLKKITLAAAAIAIASGAAVAGSHGGAMDKAEKMDGMKMDCAAMMKKMEGMKDEKTAAMLEAAKKKMEAGDEKGCVEALKGGMMEDGKMGKEMQKKM